MANIGLFYGSTTGNTEESAIEIAKALQAVDGVTVDVHEISRKTVELIANYDQLIFGIPTWDIGELQVDWELVLPEVKQLDLSGKQIALFGHGDCYAYPDTYQDAIGILGNVCLEQGANLVGFWPIEDYEFEESLGVVQEMFMGLALDDNEPEKTPARIQGWVALLIEEFALIAMPEGV